MSILAGERPVFRAVFSQREKSMLKHLLLMSAFALASLSIEASAQSWPQRSPRAIVSVAAGTITDLVPRLIFEPLSVQIGRNIIVENHPGGGATTAAAFVAKADPDGYTILVNSAAHTIAPALYPNLSYNPATDFSAVAMLGVVPSVLVVSRASGFKSVEDFVTAAKAKPGGMNFGSAGVGTATHLSAMRFMSSAGFQAVHVPFKGGLEAINEIIAGRLDFFFAPVGNALPFVRDGLLTPLVVNSERRSAALPGVPTTAEAGFRNAEYPFWIGMFVPAKTPRAVVETLHAEAAKAMESPGARSKLEALGVDPMPMSPAEMDAFVRDQIAANAALVKAADIKSH